MLTLCKNYSQPVELVPEFLSAWKVLFHQSAETMVVMAFGEVNEFMDHKVFDAVGWFFVSSGFSQMRFLFVLHGSYGFHFFCLQNSLIHCWFCIKVRIKYGKKCKRARVIEDVIILHWKSLLSCKTRELKI
jgi:hypothetical protein